MELVKIITTIINDWCNRF